MVFHLYLHRRKEKLSRTEHELIEMNEQLIRHQLEFINQSKEDREDVNNGRKRFCENETLNSLLSAYESLAEKEKIRTDIYVRMKGNIEVRDIDLATVIVNTFENAIHGCMESQSSRMQIYLSIVRKGSKLVILCRNTCGPERKLKYGLQESGIGGGAGVSGIMRVVSFYHGEADFSVENGMFTVRILLKLTDNMQSVS